MSDPSRCDHEIFSKGTAVGVLDLRSAEAEAMVVAIAERTNTRTDWHYMAGRAVVRTLGTPEEIERARQAVAAEIANGRNGYIPE